MAELYEDAVLACADLVGRAGASEFEMGWDCPHVPDEPDDHNCDGVTWHATVKYQGARVTVDKHRSPSAASLALVEKLLSGATCRCRRAVTLSGGKPGCRWRLVGREWKPSCDVPSIRVRDGERGDMAAMQRALAESGNRVERRAARKRGRR